MTEKQIFDWCMSHGELKRVYTWFSDCHYRITFENGESYEWRREEEKSNVYTVTTWINGAAALRVRYRDGWLKNGNYGAEKLEELPLETAAA